VKRRQKVTSGNSALGFIDLLAITLVVVILQTVAVIDRGDSSAEPTPTVFSLNIYQPAESPGSSASHFAFIKIGERLLLWTRSSMAITNLPEGAELKRDYYDQSSNTWRSKDNWGHNRSLHPAYYNVESGPDLAKIEAFSRAVVDELGVEVRIYVDDNDLPRIDVFFDDTVSPFELEVGYHRCNAPRSTETLYLNKYVHPVMIKWAVLGTNPSQDHRIREISKNNDDEWGGKGQFSISPKQDIEKSLSTGSSRAPGGSCDGMTPLSCAGYTSSSGTGLQRVSNSHFQRNSLISMEAAFDGSAIKITDFHGEIIHAR